MLIIYRPEGGDERTWEFVPDEMLDVEATAIERVTGWTYAEFGEKFLKGSILAWKALLWVLRRRSEPTLAFRDVSFRVKEFEWQLDPDERQKALDNLPELDTEEEREAILKFLGPRDEQTEATPKAPAPARSNGRATRATSRTS